MTASNSEKPAPDRAQWWRDHTVRRRERYNSDPEYRENRCLASRESYRKNNNITLTSCLDNLSKLESFGDNRPCVLKSDKRTLGTIPCLTMGEFGEALGGHNAPVIYRWRVKELIPQPIITGSIFVLTSGVAGAYYQRQPVYHLEEAREMVAVLGEHQKHFRYYRLSDTDTIRELFQRVYAARSKLGLV